MARWMITYESLGGHRQTILSRLSPAKFLAGTRERDRRERGKITADAPGDRPPRQICILWASEIDTRDLTNDELELLGEAAPGNGEPAAIIAGRIQAGAVSAITMVSVVDDIPINGNFQDRRVVLRTNCKPYIWKDGGWFLDDTVEPPNPGARLGHIVQLQLKPGHYKA